MSAAPGLLIGDLVRRNAEQIPERMAASLGEDRLTHCELNQAANRIAWALHDVGIGRGDRVVSWADTCLELMPLYVALAKLGAVFAPLNALYGVGEATPVARLARPSMLIADAAHADAAGRVASAAAIPKLGALGPGCNDPDRFEVLLDACAKDDERGDFVEPALVETDPHVIFFTSGSTGLPKGVVLSHRANYLRSFQGVFHDEPERSVCMFPLFHMAGFTLALCAWQTRGEIAFVKAASADEILSAVQAIRANRLYCVPAVWNRILASDLDRFDTSSLRQLDTGTSATPIELLRALARQFPQAALRIFYGATETGSGTMLGNEDVLRKPGSVGLPAAGVDLRLTEAGEVCIRSGYLMDGYFDAPETTAEVLREGWFHTGDLGAIDDEGYLSIVGRLKELIRSGGESVSPAEVESVLATHPDVDEIAVIGVPDPTWGEVVCAAAIPRPGAVLTLETLQRHCEQELAAFKKPRRLELFDVLPRTPATGQVQRVLLVELVLARAAAGSA
jgi:acyl-CoA synthetase (AMP-forming)/AMP-acid ligase II